MISNEYQLSAGAADGPIIPTYRSHQLTVQKLRRRGEQNQTTNFQLRAPEVTMAAWLVLPEPACLLCWNLGPTLPSFPTYHLPDVLYRVAVQSFGIRRKIVACRLPMGRTVQQRVMSTDGEGRPSLTRRLNHAMQEHAGPWGMVPASSARRRYVKARISNLQHTDLGAEWISKSNCMG